MTEAALSSEVDILFFVASPSRIAPGERVLLAWSIAGDYRKSEIIGPAEQVTVTTGEVRLWTAPLTQSGEIILRLRVYPANEDQETLEQSVKIAVSSEHKQPIEVVILEEQPGADLEFSQAASFTFEVRDPKGNECSWVCNHLAGDAVSFIPREGAMPAGGGIVTVSLLPPGAPRLNYVTLEVAAYDDLVLGHTPDSTRASELVSFTWESEGDSPG